MGRPESDEIKPSGGEVTPPKVVNELLVKDKTSPPPEPPPSKRPAHTPKPLPQSASSGLYPGSSSDGRGGQQLGALPFRSPAATALPGSLDIARTLRPFRKRVPQRTQFVLNEEATARRIAEEDIWVPVLGYASTRWLEVALVVDIGASMTIWRQTLIELRRLLARHGAFRDVRLWELDTNDHKKVRLYAGAGEGISQRQPRRELELIDTSGRRLILVVTDCVSAAWHSGAVADVLAKWGRYNPVTLLQVLPQWLWSRTALCIADSVHLHAPTPGAANRQLHVQTTQSWDDEESLPTMPIPIVTLEPASLAAWSRAIARAEEVWIPEFEFVIPSQGAVEQGQNGYTLYEESVSVALSAAERVQRFRAHASDPAQRLAGLLAMLPVTLRIIRLVQQAMFSEPRQVHVAEVFLSGLLKVISPHSETLDPDDVRYDFVDGVRENLLNFVSPNDSDSVLTEIATFITSKFAHPIDFGALLANPLSKEGIVIDQENRPFALMGAKALRRFGGEYRELADWLEKDSKGQIPLVPVSSSTSIEEIDSFPEVGKHEQVVVSDKVAQEVIDTRGMVEDDALKAEERDVPSERVVERTQEEEVEEMSKEEKIGEVKPQIPERVLGKIGNVRQEVEPSQIQRRGIKHKLFVITAGTVAAGVGLELLKQIKTHPNSELLTVVRYIDTAYLPGRYPEIHQGEWQQMSINAGHIQAIYRNRAMEPYLEELLYPGLLPGTAGVGGGGIRYNGAGAVVVNRNNLKKWLGNNMTELIKFGDSQTSIYMALVISAVGATGSGALERLIDVIIDAATTVGIPLPIRCNVFILQPGMQGVTDLGLANTLALYAEMAASRLSQDLTKQYQGRTIMVGWGSKHSLSSIEQLQEVAATLIRVSNDPTYGIVAEFQEREVDNHVLREMDQNTNLPTHLSSATVVTISLGNLEEKVIQRDAIRLVDGLVFGGNAQDGQSDVLLGAFSQFLSGDTPKARYTRLLESLLKGIELDSPGQSMDTMRNVPSKQQGGKLTGIWQTDRNAIEEYSNQIETQANALAQNAIRSLEHTRRERLSTGMSLERLRNECQSLQQILIRVLNEARDDTNKNTPDDTGTAKTLDTLSRATLNRQGALRNALAAVQINIEIRLRQSANPYAIAVLEELEYHCAETVNNLDVVLQRLRRERDSNSDWATDRSLKIATSHLLHIPALSSRTEDTDADDQTKRYYDKVSIFAPRQRGIGRISLSGNTDEDQLASFRKSLRDREQLDALFRGEINLLLHLAQEYARNYVHTEVQKYSIVDILTQMGGTTLQDRLAEAGTLAHSFVAYNEGFIGDRAEVCHISAYWKNEEQRGMLQKMIDQAFGEGQCTLLSSKDPSEIVVFYYVDGLPMSAINDLTGRCLDAFLKRRRAWYRQSKLDASSGSEVHSYKQRVSVPVYSGRDAEQRVIEAGVIRQLYNIRGQMVEEYKSEEIPELAGDEGTYKRSTT